MSTISDPTLFPIFKFPYLQKNDALSDCTPTWAQNQCDESLFLPPVGVDDEEDN